MNCDESPAAAPDCGKELKVREKFMREAIKEAKKAQAIGEVPIGAVIVMDGKIIGRGYNRRKTDKNTLSHAEMTAIRKACLKRGDWRLEECEMYVTLEPCPMCAGAVIQARIPVVYIGAMNPKAGCAGSVTDLFEHPGFNHRVKKVTGICGGECSALLKDFFARLRVLHPKKIKFSPGSAPSGNDFPGGSSAGAPQSGESSAGASRLGSTSVDASQSGGPSVNASQRGESD